MVTSTAVESTVNRINSDQLALIRNEMLTLTREALLRLTTQQTDIDKACNYPVTVGIQEFRTMYDRMGLARRAVEIWPNECWQTLPEIYEKETPELTEFEKRWQEMQAKLALFSWLYRADILSGIGQFGILLLGLDDGKALNLPVDGIDEKTGEATNGAKEHDLLFLRTFDESVVKVDSLEDSITSPRYGKPKFYTISFVEPGGQSTKIASNKVHWTRVIHLADNRESSETFGVSRLQAIYNNLLDIKKVSGGSGEMFWKGGFPGYAFELHPDAMQMGNVEMDKESIKEQMQLWSQGLQRYLALEYVTTKSLTPQVADPTGHVDIHLKLVALSLGIPYRILLGSEEAKLASVQDKRTWNNRVSQRQNSYLTPCVIRPLVDRLIVMGVLPKPEQYIVRWPDLNVMTDDDIAKVALNRTDAMAKYVQAGVDALIAPREYLTLVQKMTDAEAETIIDAVEELETSMEPEPEPQLQPTPGEPIPIPRQTNPAKVSV
jgi:hypothetical protein